MIADDPLRAPAPAENKRRRQAQPAAWFRTPRFDGFFGRLEQLAAPAGIFTNSPSFLPPRFSSATDTRRIFAQPVRQHAARAAATKRSHASNLSPSSAAATFRSLLSLSHSCGPAPTRTSHDAPSRTRNGKQKLTLPLRLPAHFRAHERLPSAPGSPAPPPAWPLHAPSRRNAAASAAPRSWWADACSTPSGRELGTAAPPIFHRATSASMRQPARCRPARGDVSRCLWPRPRASPVWAMKTNSP